MQSGISFPQCPTTTSYWTGINISDGVVVKRTKKISTINIILELDVEITSKTEQNHNNKS